jgi:hypothetical protein
MAGPFDKFQSPWVDLRQAPVEDRQNEPWPWYPTEKVNPPHTQTAVEKLKLLMALMQGEEIPPVTALSRDAGAKEAGDQLPDEEVLKFILGNDKGNTYGAR